MKKEKIINRLYFLFLYFMEGLCMAMAGLCVFDIFKRGNWFCILYISILTPFYIALRKERRSDRTEFGGMREFIKSIGCDDTPSV